MAITLTPASTEFTVTHPTHEPLLEGALQSHYQNGQHMDTPSFSSLSWHQRIRIFFSQKILRRPHDAEADINVVSLNPFQNLRATRSKYSSLFALCVFLTGAASTVLCMYIYKRIRRRDALQDARLWIWERYASIVRGWHYVRRALHVEHDAEGRDAAAAQNEASTQVTRTATSRTDNPLFETESTRAKALSVAFVLQNIAKHLDFIKELHSSSLRDVTIYIIVKVDSNEAEDAKRAQIAAYFAEYLRREEIMNRVLFCETDKGIMAMLRQIEPRYILISKAYESVVQEVSRLMRKSQFVVLPQDEDEDEIYKDVDARRQVIYASELQDVLPVLLS